MELNFYQGLRKVRQDNNLSPQERLLLMEIESLTHERGYCHASNEYLAKIFDVCKASVSNGISNLIKNNYISSEVNKSTNTRKIYLLDKLIKNFQLGNQENLNSYTKKLEDNNTGTNSNNLKDSTVSNLSKDFSNQSKEEFIEEQLKRYDLDDYAFRKAFEYCSKHMNYKSTAYIKNCVEKAGYKDKTYSSLAEANNFTQEELAENARLIIANNVKEY